MRKGRRSLSRTELQLWNSVAKTVVPLPERQLPELTPKREPDLALPAHQPTIREQLPKATPPLRSPLEAADPNREKRVARGRLEIDAVLDLHGLRQDEADRRTSAFISRSVTMGHRVLLVITGKGSKEGTEGRGVLRKRFLQAVEAGFYGSSLASVRPAHQRHGGSGAFYVFLKSPRNLATGRDPVTKASRSVRKRDRG